MLLKQTRINSLTHLSRINRGTNIKICVDNVSRFSKELKIFGFNEEDGHGVTILPAVFNRYSLRNAEQYFTIDKSLPKENYIQTLYWTRHEWAGRGETREVSDFVDIVRQRYHRDYHPPYSVYFTLIISDNQKRIESNEIMFCQENYEIIINTINMLLGLFRECWIESDNEEKSVHSIKLDWDILPPGDYPWERIKEDLATICRHSTRTQKHMMLRNCEEINKLKPDFRAYGRAGFRGYVVFGFTQKNLFILESIFPNNATYVFENDWEELSKLTKAEILNENLHKTRIIHNANWAEVFNALMGLTKQTSELH